MTLCPFRKAGAAPQGDAYSIMDYSAVGNGVADDTEPFYNCCEAAVAAGKDVYLPAGTYKITSPRGIYSNFCVRGVGDASVLLSTVTGTNALFLAINSTHSNVSFKDFKITGTGSARVFEFDGITNLTFHSLNMLGAFSFCAKIGSGYQTTGLTISDCTWESTSQAIAVSALYLEDVTTGVFTNSSFTAPLTCTAEPGNGNAGYFGGDLHNLAFTNCNFLGGAQYAVQLYHTGDATRDSDYMAFTNVVFNGGTGAGALFTQYKYHYVTFNGCTLNTPYGGSSMQNDVGGLGQVFDDCDFRDGNYLIEHWTDDVPANKITFQNGTYDQGAINTAAQVGCDTITNMTQV